MEQISLKKLTHVRVSWRDSTFTSGWHYPQNGRYPKHVKPLPIATIGYVIESNDEGLTVAGTVNADESILNPLTIPWGCIEKLEEIA